MELARARGIDRRERRELPAVVCGDFEESGRGPVVDHDQDRSELLVEGDQLADQRLVLDGQTGAMHVRQRQRLEHVEAVGREDRDCARARQVIRLLEVVQHPLQVGGDRLPIRVSGRLPGEPRGRLLHAVLHLDEVLAARTIARFQLQVTRHDPVWPRLDPR